MRYSWRVPLPPPLAATGVGLHGHALPAIGDDAALSWGARWPTSVTSTLNPVLALLQPAPPLPNDGPFVPVLTHCLPRGIPANILFYAAANCSPAVWNKAVAYARQLITDHVHMCSHRPLIAHARVHHHIPRQRQGTFREVSDGLGLQHANGQGIRCFLPWLNPSQGCGDSALR